MKQDMPARPRQRGPDTVGGAAKNKCDAHVRGPRGDLDWPDDRTCYVPRLQTLTASVKSQREE